MRHCGDNIVGLFVRELACSESYSRQAFRQAGFVVEESGELFRIRTPRERLDPKLAVRLFDFTRKALDGLSYDQ